MWARGGERQMIGCCAIAGAGSGAAGLSVTWSSCSALGLLPQAEHTITQVVLLHQQMDGEGQPSRVWWSTGGFRSGQWSRGPV